MDLEPLVLSLTGLVAVAAIASVVQCARLDYSDEFQLAADVWCVYRAGGCVARVYKLRGVRATSRRLEFTHLVLWGSALTTRVDVPVNTDRVVYKGYVTLRVCWNGTHLTLREMVCGARHFSGAPQASLGTP